MAAAGERLRRVPASWLGWAAAALLAVVFLSQASFFLGRMVFVRIYAFNHGWVLAWLLLVTMFTRTVRLRLLAAFWFVGVYATIALVLLIGRPIAEFLGLSNALIPGVVLPLIEELVKPLPILAVFWFAARQNRWQLGASDGLLLGFVVGAGFAFHEDVMYGRAWGSGLGGSPFSGLFPTISYFRGSMSAYHDVWLALVGLAIGAAYLLRSRTRLAWALPVAAWLIVFTDHWTGNYLGDPNSGEPFMSVAAALRGLVLDGALSVIALVAGIVLAVLGELAILRSTGRRDWIFPPVRPGAFLDAARTGSFGRLQALREYARRRRSAHYALWARGDGSEQAPALRAMGEELAVLAERAGIEPLRPAPAGSGATP